MPSYEQRGKSKQWSVRWYEDGKNMRLSGFLTKREAREAYEQHQFELQSRPQVTKKAGLTFGQLCAEYYEYAKTQMKTSSFYDTQSRLNLHVVPFFENTYCSDINASTILEWQNKLSAEYSRKYVLALRGAFSAVWSYGIQFKDFNNNPFAKVKRPKESEQPREEMQVWSLEEFEKFRSVAEDKTFNLFFSLLYYSGLRKGEALALSPSDLTNGCVRVNKSLTRKGSEAWTITTPKTKQSVRTISLPIELYNSLVELTPGGRFLFGGDSPLAERTIDRKFSAYTKAAEIKRIRIHDLRHSHASLLISNGVSIVAVSKRLGHKSTQMTLDTYSHIMPSDEDVIANLLQKSWV